MNKAAWIGVVVWIGLMAAGWWWYQGQRDGDQPISVTSAPQVLEAPTAAPEIRYPIAQPDPPPSIDYDHESSVPETVPPPPAPSLPSLSASDEPIRTDIKGLVGAEAVEAFLIPNRFISKLVVSINSLDSRPVPMRFRPAEHTKGLLEVEPAGEKYRLSERNYARYDSAVKFVAALDPAATAALYIRYYPLFQEAWLGLGSADAYFNDRVIAIIDHLLAAPVVDGPIELERPKVLYRFTDPKLEQLSFGHKALIRMGPEHAATIQAKLRAIRAEILAQSNG